MKQTALPSSLWIKNRKKLAQQLPENALAILHTNDSMPRKGDMFFPFTPQSDFLYLSGITQEESALLLCPSHPNPSKREILFLSKPNPLHDIWTGEKLTKEKAFLQSGIETIVWTEEFETVLDSLLPHIQKVFCIDPPSEETRNVPFLSRNGRLATAFSQQYPRILLYSLRTILDNLRVRKEPEEIALMRTAIKITKETFLLLSQQVQPGMTEYELEAIMMQEFIKKGAMGHAFNPIIASGKHATILHYEKNESTLKDGDLILFDFGCEYGHYASDLSMTIPINGEMNPRQKEVYNEVLSVFREIRSAIKPGISIMDLNRKTTDLITKSCLRLGLISAKDLKKDELAFRKYYPHSVSHFIGIDTHDVGSRTEPLESNMIISCEPGIYIPEEGIGIRIETDILVTADGNEDLFALIHP